MASDYIECNFPPAKFIRENTPADQLEHVMSEAFETAIELAEGFDDILCDDPHGAALNDDILMEATDLYHSLETFWRILAKERGPEFVAALFARVEQKNRERGYYD